MDDLEAIDRAIDRVVNGLPNRHTQKAYSAALRMFRQWLALSGRHSLDVATVRSHILHLREAGSGASVINTRLAALGKVASCMVAHGDMHGAIAQGILALPREERSLKHPTRCLARDEIKALLDLPNEASIKGARDRAILAAMLGCGLSMYEIINLKVEHLGQNGIVCIRGAGERARSVVMPEWVRRSVGAYLFASKIDSGILFRSLRRGNRLQNKCLDTTSISQMISHYASQLNLNIGPLDLRKSAIALTEQESIDYQKRIADLERETASLRRALNIKANLPHEQLAKAVVYHSKE